MDNPANEASQVQPYRRPPVTKLRRLVQYGFLLTTLAIGVQFTLWLAALQRGAEPAVARPPGVEAFLPISALVSLKHWIYTGAINTIHPAGLVLFLIILATAVFLKKGFCSWVCPVGLLSEYLARLNQLIFKAVRAPTGCWDFGLRSIKYLLALFFVYAVIGQMNQEAITKFVASPYNQVADIKMWMFFAPPTLFASAVLVLLVVMSVVWPYFWCRYLCPYGALLGFFSIFSVLSVKRDTGTCINCEACAKACPARLPVHRLATVSSDECHACMQCVEACPVPDTLALAALARTDKQGRHIPRLRLDWRAYAAIIALLFILGTGLARLLGVWDNTLTNDEYRAHLEHIDSPTYTHTGGLTGE